jgi:phosphatidylglycerol:prolipoprotein diacylglycerol transferase
MLALQFPDFDPVLIQIGPLAIRWYALAYIAGLLGGWWYILRLLKTQYLWDGPPFNGKPQVTADHIGDLFVWAALGVIAGGRLGYVLFSA